MFPLLVSPSSDSPLDDPSLSDPFLDFFNINPYPVADIYDCDALSQLLPSAPSSIDRLELGDVFPPNMSLPEAPSSSDCPVFLQGDDLDHLFDDPALDVSILPPIHFPPHSMGNGDRFPYLELTSIREKDLPARAEDALRTRLAINLQAVSESPGLAFEQPAADRQEGPLNGERLLNSSALSRPRTPRHGPSRTPNRMLSNPPTPYSFPGSTSTPFSSSFSTRLPSVISTPSSSPPCSVVLSDNDRDSSDPEYLFQKSGRRKKRQHIRRSSRSRPVPRSPSERSEREKSTHLKTILEDLPFSREDIRDLMDDNGLFHCPFPYCNHTTSSEGDLGRHLESSIHGTHRYICLAVGCLRAFSRDDSMKRHHSNNQGKPHKSEHDRMVKREIPYRVRLNELDWVRDRVRCEDRDES